MGGAFVQAITQRTHSADFCGVWAKIPEVFFKPPIASAHSRRNFAR